MTETLNDRMRRQITEAQDRHLAGVWGMTYVRAAMDPRYNDPAALDRLVRSLLSTGLNGAPDMAAAAIAGWVQGHPEPKCTCPWVPTEAPSWDEEENRTRHPHHREWSWTCPIDRHRDYRAALFRRTQERVS